MIAAVWDVLVHPLEGTVRATRHWPARECHLRSLVALMVLGAVTAGGCELYYSLAHAAAIEVVIMFADVRVQYFLPVLAACGQAGGMVLLGGAFVRFAAYSEWERAIDENQYVRLMAAAMWAMVPFTLLGIGLGIALNVLSGNHAILLIVVPVSIAISFAVLARMVVRRLYRGELGDRMCDRCGYMLLGLQDPRCPECGQPFPEDWLISQRQVEPVIAGATDGGTGVPPVKLPA